MTKYNFNDIQSADGGAYITQLVEHRRLTEIYHSHDFYEWVLIAEGICSQLIDDVSVSLKKMQGVLIPPEAKHKFTSQSSDVRLISLSVEASELCRFFEAFELTLPTEVRTFSVSEDDLHVILRLLSGDVSNRKLLLSHLVVRYGNSTQAKAEIPKRLEAATELMSKAENLKEGINAYIRLSGYSQSQLSRLLKKHYGRGLNDYVKEMRLLSAYKRITLTDEYIEDIAEAVGYESFSHFSKIFKERFGITPPSLRKKTLGNL